MRIFYLYVFLQSNLLEVPFYHWGFGRSLADRWRDSLWWVTAINSLTHPIVFFVIMNLNGTYLQNILLAEAFAIGAETAYFRFLTRSPWWRCLAVSAVANVVSWQAAPALTYLAWG